MSRPHSSSPSPSASGAYPPPKWQHNDSSTTTSTVWRRNKGIFFILLAQVAGSCMDAIARFLQQTGRERGGRAMHPFQIIVARMGVTFNLSTIYMWYTRVPDFPLGQKSARGWLLLRAVFGYSGLFCLYYSVAYLPLAENTVLRFLVPIVTAIASAMFLGQPFTRRDLAAGLVALAGVIIIAHPEAIFGGPHREEHDVGASKAGKVDDVTPTQRLVAVAVALLGVFFAAAAYTMIRIIGDRAHALISVNYFAVLATVGSTIALLAVPGIGFLLPANALEWILLLLLGILGFILQFLLTAGLQLDKSNKATSMLYSQVLLSLLFDWGVWGVLPDTWSCIGGAIVIVSTLWSALQKSPKTAEARSADTVDEESALLGAEAQDTEGEVIRRRASLGA